MFSFRFNLNVDTAEKKMMKMMMIVLTLHTEP